MVAINDREAVHRVALEALVAAGLDNPDRHVLGGASPEAMAGEVRVARVSGPRQL